MPIVVNEVNEVITRLFSFTAAEYPAITEAPKLFQIPLPGRSIQIVSDKTRGKSFAADTFYQYIIHAATMYLQNLDKA